MDQPIPLDDQDIQILGIEGPTIVGHTCKVIRLAAPGISFDQLFYLVAERVGSVPELGHKLGQGPDGLSWVADDDFSLERHLAPYAEGSLLSESELAEAAGSLFSEKLDRAHPLWRIDVAEAEDGGTALIWRIHHSLADGTTAMRIARELLWAETPSGSAVSSPVGTPSPEQTKADPAGAPGKADDARRRRHLIGLFEREFARTGGPSPFDGVIGTVRSIAFATISLSELHDAGKRAAGATLNDSVLSVVAGAIRHWMELHHERDLGAVRVRVPVSLHHGDDDGGNRDSFFTVPLPLDEPDPIRRLTAIREETSLRKEDHDAEEIDSLLRRISHASPRLRHLYSRFESNPRRFALNISNVRGPSRPVSVLDAPVETVHSIVEIGEHHALRVSALSVGDQLCFGFCADPELVKDLDQMAAGIEWASSRLITASQAV